MVRIILTLAGVMVLGLSLRPLFLPPEFGEHGYYRPGAVSDEANRQARNMTTESCLECHPLIRKIHVAGVHKDISCEFCHGAYADHIKRDTVVGIMPVVRGENIRTLCLRCHNKIVQARPPEMIKLVGYPEHQTDKKVRREHVCNECHHVHAPMKWVHEAREMMGLPKDQEVHSSWTK